MVNFSYSLLQRTHCLKSPQINSPQQSHHVGFRRWHETNACPLPTCLTWAFSSVTFSVVTDRFILARFFVPFLLTKLEIKSFTGLKLLGACFAGGMWGTETARVLSLWSLLIVLNSLWLLPGEFGLRGFGSSSSKTSSFSIIEIAYSSQNMPLSKMSNDLKNSQLWKRFLGELFSTVFSSVCIRAWDEETRKEGLFVNCCRSQTCFETETQTWGRRSPCWWSRNMICPKGSVASWSKSVSPWVGRLGTLLRNSIFYFCFFTFQQWKIVKPVLFWSFIL